MRVAFAVIIVFMMVCAPAALSAGTNTVLLEISAEGKVLGPSPVATLASVMQRADCNMTCEGDCCTETCCGPDGCETCKTCCPGGDCSKYCYEHQKGKKKTRNPSGDKKAPAGTK